MKYLIAFFLALGCQAILRGLLGITYWPALIISIVITMAYLLACELTPRDDR